MFKLVLFLLFAAPAAGAITCGTSTGDFKVVGSTTIRPIVADAAKKWNPVCTKNKVTDFGGGSGQGALAVCNGTALIGMLSRPFKTTEATGSGSSFTCLTGKKGGLISFPIAYDGVVVAAAKGSDGDKCITALGKAGLSKALLTSIFSGAITTWSKVAPACASITSSITTIGSDSAQTSYATILGVVGSFGPKYVPVPEKDIAAKIISTKGSIGFLPLDYYQFNAAKLSAAFPIGGVSPIPTTTIQSGTYPFKRILNLAIDKASLPTVKFFVQYLLSTEGQAGVTNGKFVALNSNDLAKSKALVK